ncbi:hypothetical protein [Gloeothece citriformis]|nr:hypothetical protein [Gloeothece citriformis]
MNNFWDIVVLDQEYKPVLVVEVKRRFNVSPLSAAQFRHNLFANQMMTKASFFLLAFPDKFYLWTQGEAQLENYQPDFIIDARPILKPYFEKAGVSPEQITPVSLELLIGVWLESIIESQKPCEEIEINQQWVIESGLYDAIAKGHLVYEAAA